MARLFISLKDCLGGSIVGILPSEKASTVRLVTRLPMLHGYDQTLGTFETKAVYAKGSEIKLPNTWTNRTMRYIDKIGKKLHGI